MIPPQSDDTNRSLKGAATYGNRWLDLEKTFETNLYNGESDPGDVLFVAGTRRPRLLLAAVHSVNHTRDGETKFADRGTGGLVLLLAEIVGCSALIIRGRDPGDANWDVNHSTRDVILSHFGLPGTIIDFHGMKHRGIDLEFGTGHTTDYPHALLDELKSSGHQYVVAVDEVFNGARPGTLTNWAQQAGYKACQLEISSRLRPPTGSTDVLSDLVEFLASALIRVTTESEGPNP